MLAHSLFEEVLGVSNVKLASVLADYFVDYNALPAVISISTAILFAWSAIAIKRFKVQRGHSICQLFREVSLEQFTQVSESVVRHGHSEP
jgi:hypothetical protein